MLFPNMVSRTLEIGIPSTFIQIISLCRIEMQERKKGVQVAISFVALIARKSLLPNRLTLKIFELGQVNLLNCFNVFYVSPFPFGILEHRTSEVNHFFMFLCFSFSFWCTKTYIKVSKFSIPTWTPLFANLLRKQTRFP